MIGAIGHVDFEVGEILDFFIFGQSTSIRSELADRAADNLRANGLLKPGDLWTADVTPFVGRGFKPKVRVTVGLEEP